jgi:hypothetical protein
MAGSYVPAMRTRAGNIVVGSFTAWIALVIVLNGPLFPGPGTGEVPLLLLFPIRAFTK